MNNIAFNMNVDELLPICYNCAVLFSYTAPHDELSVRDVRQNAATAAVIKSPLLSSGMWRC